MFIMRLAALVTGSISFLLIVIGLAIPYWIYISDKEELFPGSGTNFTFTANIGFWDYCMRTELYGVLHSECGKLYESNRSDMVDASAAMILIGMLMIAGSVVVCVTSILCMKENKRLPIVGGVCSLFAGICMLIGVALYGHEYRQILKYGPSFYMAIVATALALVSGIIQISNRIIFTKRDII